MREKLWVDLSIRAQRISNGLTDILLDGLYLSTFPVVGEILSPLILLAGFLAGFLHPGFKTVFSESLPFMIVAGSIGILSARLGLLFVSGFAIGDFFLVQRLASYPLHGPVRNFLETRPSLIIEYVLLSLLLVWIPMVVKEFLGTIRLPKKFSDDQVFYVTLAGTATLTGLFVFFWTQAVPVLIRPVFAWNSIYFPVSMAKPLQESGYQLVAALVFVSLIRVFLQHLVLTTPKFSQTYLMFSEKLFKAKPVIPITEQIPLLVRMLISSFWMVFLLSGLLSNWTQAVILAVVFAVFSVFRNGLVSLPFGPLARLTNKVPTIVRFIIGLVLVNLVANRAVLSRSANDGFEPILITIAISLAIFFLLTPPYFAKEEKQE